MKSVLVSCPEEEKLLDYIFNELATEEMFSLENHLFSCDACVNKVRKYNQAFELLLYLKESNNQLGSSWKKRNYDIAMLPAAAGAEQNEGISEVMSSDGRYCIRLVPFLNKNKYLLEIQVMDKGVAGVLRVENTSGEVFSSRIMDSLAREVVDCPIDLRNIIISVDRDK